MQNNKCSKVLAALLAFAFTVQPAHAGVTLDGTLGRSGPITGPNYAITADLGKQVGSNLFHSFSQFNLVKGDVATFSGPTNIANIISRVTGGSASSIDGTIRSTISGANMYLINPAGVMFGPNASIDIGGSFHVSTADYLKLGTDGRFDALKPENSILTMSPPSAFGFTGTSRTAITIKDGSTLAMKPSQGVSIVAGDVEINKGTVSTQDGGDIRVVALGRKRQEVAVTGGLPDAIGELTLINGGFILSSTVSEANGGSIKVSAGSITIDGGNDFTSIYSLTAATGNAGGIEVTATDNVSVINIGRIVSATFSSGDAGPIKVSAGSITIDGQGRRFTGISSQTFPGPDKSDTGNTGTVEVTTLGNLFILSGGEIHTGTSSSGDAGMVKVNAGSITIEGQGTDTQISSYADYNSSGKSGTVEVTANETVSILNLGSIFSGTASSGDSGMVKVNASSITIDAQGGSAGIRCNSNAEVTASETVSILKGGHISASMLKVNADSITIDGQGDTAGLHGTMEVTANKTVSILNGGLISSSTFSSGNAGMVKVNAGSISIDGQGSKYSTGIISNAASSSSGNAGTIEVTSNDTVSILNGGEISSSTFSSGDAGMVKVNAGSITIDSSSITSKSELKSSGKAGAVEVTANETVSILNSGEISSSTFSSGDAGMVKVNAGSIMIDKQGTIGFTGIASEANYSSTGNAGTVEVTVKKSLAIQDGGAISSSTHSSGDAGMVKVNAGSITIEGPSYMKSRPVIGITSQAISGTGNAGTVEVTATGTVTILSAGQITSSTFTSGDAGMVKVNAGSIMIDRQGSRLFTGIGSQANWGTGDAGTVEVTVNETLSILNGGIISSTTFTSGDAGMVTVNAGSITIDGQGSSWYTGISSQADLHSTGNAGTVEVTANETLSILNGGKISTSTFSSGDAGMVKVNAGSILIDRQGSTYSTGIISQADTGSGNAGVVDISASGNLSILNGGKISSSTFSSGDAGQVKVSAGSITIDSQGSKNFTGIISAADIESSGNAGSVTVQAGTLSMSNQAAISSESLSTGRAGDLNLKVLNQINLTDSSITTSTTRSDGGNITISDTRLIDMRNSQITTSVKGGTGDGGNITIAAKQLVVDHSDIIANAEGGNGGNINLNIQALIQSVSGSTISASSRLGISGTVSISSPLVDIGAGLAAMPDTLKDINSLSPKRCATSDEEISSFSVLECSGSILNPDRPVITP